MNSIVVNISGYGSFYLGKFNEVDSSQIARFIESQGYDCYVSEPEIQRKAVANPAERMTTSRVADTAFRSLTSLTDWKEKRPLFPTKCAVGRSTHKSGSSLDKLMSSDSKAVIKMLEDISLEEAVANLCVFFPAFAERMPSKLRTKIKSKKHISQKDIDSCSNKEKLTLNTISEYLVQNKFLRANTKLAKSKIPSSIGLGDVYEDDPDYSESMIPGSKGIVFLPNSTLVKDSKFTGEQSYLNVIREAEYLGEDESRRVALDVFKEMTDFVLTPFESKSDRDVTCCPKASAGCRTVCNFSSGMRYDSRVDAFGQKVTREELGKTYNRVNAGFLHTAFLANPIYFIRILIEALKHQVREHDTEICVANIELEEPLDFESVSNYLPTAIRLNVYSDYPWEIICPALFDLFGKSTSFKFQGKKLPYIQFYDYTKIPGRWRAEIREDLIDQLLESDEFLQYSGKSRKKGPSVARLVMLARDSFYKLPENYHITFSFSGTNSSFEESTFALEYANQNATYVFKTITLGSDLTNKMKKDMDEMSSNEKEAFETLLSFVKALQGKMKKMGVRAVKDTLLYPLGTMPKEFFGKQVVNGDYYDIRYLDEYMKEDPDKGVIVGLSFKVAKNIRMDVGGGHEVNPLSASLFQRNHSVAQFAFMRLGLGLGIGESSVDPKSLLRVVITPTELGATNVVSTLKDLSDVKASLDEAEAITFANEEGEPFGYEENAKNLQRFCDSLLEETAFNLEIK